MNPASSRNKAIGVILAVAVFFGVGYIAPYHSYNGGGVTAVDTDFSETNSVTAMGSLSSQFEVDGEGGEVGGLSSTMNLKKSSKKSKKSSSSSSDDDEDDDSSSSGSKKSKKSKKSSSSSSNDDDSSSSSKKSSSSSSKKSKSKSTTDEDQTIDFVLYNEYTKYQGPNSLYPWDKTAEPYRATTMEVVDPEEGATYTWVVDGHTQGYGATVDVLFSTTGYATVKLIKVGGGSRTYRTFSVVLKYVRREIRSLNDQDREAFFNAVSILQRIPTRVGQSLYGSNYYSKDYFNRLHLYYGGTSDCDHWHQGAGFVTSHMTFTLMFERALQAVNPSVAVPYWDFTLESTFYKADTFRESPIFSDDWFGDASPDNDLHTVTKGRWAYVPAMMNAENFSQVLNSYGVLRAPWNNDPTPFMTRHDHVYGYMNNLKPSGCQEYFIAMRKTNWMSMSKQLNAAAHGHIHETVGGSWNHELARVNDYAVHPAVYTFAHQIQALSKELWRTGFLDCPAAGSCKMDKKWTDCQCSCPADVLDGTSGKAYDILDAAGVLGAVSFYDAEGLLISQFYDDDGNIYYTLPNHTAEESEHIYTSLLHLLCNPGHIGTMFQATSSNDITFWVLHPTVDRLWHYKRLSEAGKDSYDETWDPYHTCYGHNPDDIQPFKNLFDETDDDGNTIHKNKFYSNSELYELLRPDEELLPYMYDNFNWPHCETLGYNMVIG